VIGNFEITTYIDSRHGHKNVQSMNTGGAVAFPWGRVRQTPARHSSSFPDGTYGGNPNGYLLDIEGKTVYNAGDTDVFAEMEWIGEEGPIDVALLPIGDCFTMGPDSSVRAASLLKPALVIPVHYDTFPQIRVDTGEWQKKMKNAGFRTKVMKPGEDLEL
jgi:L-ascorbate metabolism protein UlaG (beta-lactamase superfamily)